MLHDARHRKQMHVNATTMTAEKPNVNRANAITSPRQMCPNLSDFHSFFFSIFFRSIFLSIISPFRLRHFAD